VGGILSCPNAAAITARYKEYNGTNDEETQRAMGAFTQGLYSAIATLGAVPIIRAPPNGASEMVARQLSDAIAQAWSGGAADGPFHDAGSAVSARPLVIILDRALDFSTALQHTSVAQTM
jgi:hypothetical protein